MTIGTEIRDYLRTKVGMEAEAGLNDAQKQLVRRLETCISMEEVLVLLGEQVQIISSQRDEAEADAQKLAKHCLVVIRNGDGTEVMWCTVCQRKMTTAELRTKRFQHDDDCLVKKVRQGA